MDDLLLEFLSETAENLDAVDVQLIRFEADPHDRSALDGAFRLLHTIKGTCGFLGLPRLEALSHAGESLLSHFRHGDLPVTPETVTLVLRAIDGIKSQLAHLRSHGVESEGDDAPLIAALTAGSAPLQPDAAGLADPFEAAVTQDPGSTDDVP